MRSTSSGPTRPVLRPVHADQELLREQLRARLAAACPEPDELKLLEPYRDRLPPRGVHRAVSTRRSPTDPATSATICATAVALLKAAGYEIKGGKLVNDATGQPFEFEIMNDGPRFERIVGPFAKSLERLGIKVDHPQRRRRPVPDIRIATYDFDMLSVTSAQRLSPGNEQRRVLGSAAADTPGSPNLIGIKDPVVDELIEQDHHRRHAREDLITACRALDRVLLLGHYVIPQLVPGQGTASPSGTSSTIRRRWPRYGVDLFAWWVNPGRGAPRSTRPARTGADRELSPEQPMLGLPHPPAPAGDPDPARDHGDQFRDRAGAARRPGRSA